MPKQAELTDWEEKQKKGYEQEHRAGQEEEEVLAGEIVPAEEAGEEGVSTDAVMITPMDLLAQVVQRAEMQIELRKKIRQIVLGITTENDWVDMGGKPYPKATATEAIGRQFGISWEFMKDPDQCPPIPDGEGGHYRYEIPMRFTIQDPRTKTMHSIEIVGTRRSRDPFFTTRYDYVPDGRGGSTKKAIVLPVIEVDPGKVKKSAISNAINSGIMRLLGMRNLTWEDLAKGGIKRENLAKVDYKKEKTA